MSLSFAFDPSKGETPQTIAQRRQMSNLIAAQMLGRAPKNVGEGLNAIGQALIARSMMGEADAAQKAGDASLPDFLKLGTPAAPSVATSPAIATAPMGNLPAMTPAPAAPTTGKIYSNDEPSPLDPPSGADRQAMIATILGEAGNQGPTGQAAVASVIRNRAINGGYGGDTPTGVVTAPNQFEPWNTADGRARMAAAAADPTQRAAADHAIALAYGEGGTAPTDPTNGALNFFSPKAQAALGRPVPTWAQGPGQDIGDHRFFGGQPPQQPYQVAGPAVAAPQPSQDGGVPTDNSPSPLDNAQYPAGPVGAPATAAGESPAPTGNSAVAANPANAQPAQGALPTAQASQPAAQPQNRFLFKNASDEDLQKALLNPFTPTNIRAALTQEATLRANAAQKAADPMRALDMRSKELAIKKAQQDLEDGKIPVGFQKTDKGLEPIPGGPADLAYLRAKAIKQKDPNAINVLGRGGELYKIGPDGNPVIVHKNETETALLDDQTTAAMAAQYLAGDKSVMQNLGRGGQGAANVIKLRTAIYRQAQDAGLNGRDIVDNFNEQAGALAGQRAVGTRAANISLAANEANNMIPIALAASDKLPRSQYMPWNSMVQAVQKGSSSPELASFVAATNSLVNSYVRAVSPSGVPTDSMREHAYSMLNQAQGPEAYKSVIRTMQQEMKAALEAPSQVKKELRHKSEDTTNTGTSDLKKKYGLE